MIFNSLTYIAFLFVATVLYWMLPRGPRLWMIFLASITFYGFWSFSFVPLLMASVVLDYVAALWIAALPDGRKRNAILTAAIAANLGFLFVSKYLVFVLGQAEGLARWLGIEPGIGFSLPFHVILPLGISFYTFQSMSYTIDVWRRAIAPTRDFILFADYVLYFPQLVAGPILRAGEVIWQLDRRPEFSWSHVSAGLQSVIAGLFLKCVLADNIAPLVDSGFGARDGSDLGAVDVIVISFLFGFQIYFDFAGYSLIAIGSARIMGLRFPNNFDFPYLAANPRDFWRRWHISLSSWIRDYLYLPLCRVRGRSHSEGGLDVAPGADAGRRRRTMALWVTWTLMGFWHGANWTFLLWGLWHAALVSLHRLFAARLPWSVPGPLSWAATLPLVMLGWIPFRATSLDHALELWGRLLVWEGWFHKSAQGGLPIRLALHRDSYYVAAIVMILIVAAWAVHRYVLPRMGDRPRMNLALQGIAMAVAVPLIVLFLRPIHQFIYFQF
ncbi:MAG: MBOAT family protein [Alphaproteobacteria bacterium]|nr:MBOAT family protein [Alphaproteobacteria bacterium]